MPGQIKIAEEVRKEAEKTIKALKNIGNRDNKSWSEVRDNYLD